MPRVEREIVIDAPVETVFACITDYEKYPDFLPEMQAVEVVSREENTVVVRFELELLMRITYTLRLTESAPTELSWTLEEAKMMSQNSGGWKLESLGENQTKATYGLEVKLRGLIPKSVSTRLMGTTLPQTLERFKESIEGS